MDWTKNKVPGVQVKYFPTIKFYPKENKRGIDYEDERSIEDFKNFLTNNSASFRTLQAG